MLVFLATLTFGPSRLLGHFPHKTARRHRRPDMRTDRQLVVFLAGVYVLAVAALVLQLDHIRRWAVAGTGLSVTAGLVFCLVWVHARGNYDQFGPSPDLVAPGGGADAGRPSVR